MVLRRLLQNWASTPEARAASISKSWRMWTRRCCRRWPQKRSPGVRDKQATLQDPRWQSCRSPAYGVRESVESLEQTVAEFVLKGKQGLHWVRIPSVDLQQTQLPDGP